MLCHLHCCHVSHETRSRCRRNVIPKPLHVAHDIYKQNVYTGKVRAVRKQYIYFVVLVVELRLKYLMMNNKKEPKINFTRCKPQYCIDVTFAEFCSVSVRRSVFKILAFQHLDRFQLIMVQMKFLMKGYAPFRRGNTFNLSVVSQKQKMPQFTWKLFHVYLRGNLCFFKDLLGLKER